MDQVDNFEKALFDTTHRIVAKAVVLSEKAQDLAEAIRELLAKEAPEGMPLGWVMYIREVAAGLGQDGPDTRRQTLLRRVGDAIVEAIDEGEIYGLWQNDVYEMRLEGKVSLITGGARGIGAAIATLFAQEGSSISIGDVLEAQGEKKAEGLRRLGRLATFRTLDVTKEEDWQGAVEAIINEFGRLDILVNNAGIGTRMGLEKVSQEEWEKTMDVNAKGGYLGIKNCVPSMIQTGGGSIVNISSIAAMVGGHTSMAYRASKGALRALTKAMALRYAPYQIRVNSIHPGDVVTPLNQEYLADPARLEERIRMVPLGRLGTPEDVAYLALYLASDQAGYVTGIEVIIDGGRTAG